MKKSLWIISLMMLLSVEILTPITYAVEWEESDFESYVKESILDEVIQEETSEEIEEVSNQEDTEENLDEDNQEDEDSEISEEADDEAVIDETTVSEESESEEQVKEESSEEASQSDTLEQFDFSKETRPAVIANKLWIDWEKEKWDYAILAWVEWEYIWSSEQNTQIKEYLIEHANEIVNGSEEVVEPEESVKSVEQEVIELNKEEIKGFKYYNGVTVNVSAPVESFPEGTTLSITPIKKAAELKEIKEQLVEQQDEVTEESNLVAFDISFIYNNEEVQPVENKSVEVTFNYWNHEAFSQAEENEEQEIKVYHLNDKDEDWNKQEVTVEEIEIVKTEEWKLTVDAESFSVYTIVTQVAEEWPNAIEDQLANFVYGQISIEDPDHPWQWITIMDRNLGASMTWAWADADPRSYGYHYQWWNNYWFDSSKTVLDDWYLGYGQINVPEWTTGYYNKKYRTGNPDWMTTNRASLWGWNWVQGPCPEGWHVPSAIEWSHLLEYYVGYYNKKYGSNLQLDWNSYKSIFNEDFSSDFSNFFALSYVGMRSFNNSSLSSTGTNWAFWSSTLWGNWGYELNISKSSVNSNGQYHTAVGLSVRCFKDNYEPENATDHNITFDFNWWSWSTAATHVVNWGTGVIPTAPVKLGYELEWWYNNGVKWTFEEDEVNGEIVLQAHYTPITYTLVYTAWEWTGDPVEETLKYDEPYTLLWNVWFTKTWYGFSGWKIDDIDYAEWDNIENLTTVSWNTVTATAQWKANEYDVVFLSWWADGKTDVEETVAYNETLDFPTISEYRWSSLFRYN